MVCIAAILAVLLGCRERTAAGPTTPQHVASTATPPNSGAAVPNSGAAAPEDATLPLPPRMSSRPERQRVEIRTRDGWTLAGWLDRGTAPAWVILVHQLGSSHTEWEPLISLLHRREPPLPSVLAIDLRGHGASVTGPAGETRFQSFGTSATAWAGVVVDVESAVNHARSLPGAARTDRIVVVGSSIGSSATLRHAAGDTGITGVVMLSPGVSYRGLDTLEPMQRFAATGRAALLLSSDGDTGSAEAVRALLARAAGRTGVTSQLYGHSSAHGVSIAAQDAHPEMWTRIREWIDSQLGLPPSRL